MTLHARAAEAVERLRSLAKVERGCGDLDGYESTTALATLIQELAAALPEWQPEDAGEAVVVDGAIVIRIPVKNLPQALEGTPSNYGVDTTALYHVSNPAAFAKNVCDRLNEEDEVGTTPIHRMFDAAMIECIEQGDEGVEPGPLPAAPTPEGEAG